jgi:ABC-type polysaccharide/polyol phosphate transport system ATPase subunit
MVSISLKNVGLTYPIRQKVTLEWRGRKAPTGGQIGGSGRHLTVAALEGISFALNRGDRLGLVGSNGAGKTTLLKLLYGVYPPTEGSIESSGKVDALFNTSLGFRREATGRRNIMLRGLINGWSKKQIEARTDEIIAFSELGEFIDLPIKSYSSGMSARLAFSVATALDPEILLMDEWIGAGDASFRKKARERMQAIADQAGIIVLASHNHGLLKRVCNKVLELEKGRAKWYGPAGEWFDAHADQSD